MAGYQSEIGSCIMPQDRLVDPEDKSAETGIVKRVGWMDRTLQEMIFAHRNEFHFRPSFLRSEVARSMTLGDILARPAETLQRIQASSNVGEVTIARLRRVLALEIAAAAPLEWAELEEDESGTVGENTPSAGSSADLSAQIRSFRRIWAVAQESWPVKGVFHGAYADEGNSVMSLGLSETDPFTYVPMSFPEMLKTEAVFRAEQGLEGQKQAYHARLKSLGREDVRLPPRSLILMDRFVLSDLASCSGQYSSLKPEDATEQLLLLADYLLLDPKLRVAVADLRKHGVSSGFCTRKGPLYHYCFGGYLELKSPEICQHFLASARAAERSGMPFRSWLEELGRGQGIGRQETSRNSPSAGLSRQLKLAGYAR